MEHGVLLRIGLVAHDGTPQAHVVQPLARLHLDHLGAHVGQHHAGNRSGQHPPEIQHPVPRQDARTLICGLIRTHSSTFARYRAFRYGAERSTPPPPASRPTPPLRQSACNRRRTPGSPPKAWRKQRPPQSFPAMMITSGRWFLRIANCRAIRQLPRNTTTAIMAMRSIKVPPTRHCEEQRDAAIPNRAHHRRQIAAPDRGPQRPPPVPSASPGPAQRQGRPQSPVYAVPP